MATIFTTTLTVKSGSEAQFEHLQRELTHVSRQTQPGLRAFEFSRHRTQPRSYFVYARFVDEAAFRDYVASPAHEQLTPLMKDYVEGAVDVQFHDLIS
jgi:quinol monooxygenase YgiN